MPGSVRTRVRAAPGCASRNCAALLQYEGTCSGRDRLAVTNCPVHRAGRSAPTRPAAATAATVPTILHRRATAATPAPRRTATPRTTSGVARLVLRSARPAVEFAELALTTRPNGEGSDKGWAPTARIVPTRMRAT